MTFWTKEKGQKKKMDNHPVLDELVSAQTWHHNSDISIPKTTASRHPFARIWKY